MQNDERRIAVFIDFENVAMGVRESKYGNFDIELVLKRLVEKGKIMVKRAYSDWHRYAEFKRAFHQAAIELIDVPQTRYSGKNSADIRIVVDALDLSYQKEHIDTFVLVSGDSDFSPLVSKLRENGRYVIGMGVKQSSSDLLVKNCDEFIYYEDLVRPTAVTPALDPRLHHLTPKKAEAMRLVLETFQALQREGKEVIYGSMIKQTLIRKLPSFNETYYGYPTFSRLLEDAAENKVLKVAKEARSGGYIVTAITEPAGQGTTGAAETNGETGQELARGTEIVTASLGTSSAAGQSEPRDQYRRSRGGRGRWSRGNQRPTELQQGAAPVVPLVKESVSAEPTPEAAVTYPEPTGIQAFSSTEAAPEAADQSAPESIARQSVETVGHQSPGPSVEIMPLPAVAPGQHPDSQPRRLQPRRGPRRQARSGRTRERHQPPQERSLLFDMTGPAETTSPQIGVEVFPTPKVTSVESRSSSAHKSIDKDYTSAPDQAAPVESLPTSVETASRPRSGHSSRGRNRGNKKASGTTRKK